MTRAAVWRWILRQPGPVSNSALRARFNCSTLAATAALNKLGEAGAIRLQGYGRSARWTVVNRRAIVEDMRGVHPKSIDNLRVRWADKTGKGKAKYASHPGWAPATDLDRAWR